MRRYSRVVLLAVGRVVLLAVGVGIVIGIMLCFGNSEGKIVGGNGTVVWLNFEGGFWGIVGDDGNHYDPINLGSEFQSKNLRVHFVAKILERGSFHMWGEVVEILNIRKLFL